jgi:hypothetical protein
VLVRLIEYLIVAGVIGAIVQAVRVSRRKTLPDDADPDSRRAHALRDSISKLLPASSGELQERVDDLLGEIDTLCAFRRDLRAHAELAGERGDAAMKKVDADVARALSWLGETQATLLDAASDRVDAGLDELAGKLREERAELQAAADSRRELAALLRRGTAG